MNKQKETQMKFFDTNGNALLKEESNQIDKLLSTADKRHIAIEKAEINNFKLYSNGKVKVFSVESDSPEEIALKLKQLGTVEHALSFFNVTLETKLESVRDMCKALNVKHSYKLGIEIIDTENQTIKITILYC